MKSLPSGFLLFLMCYCFGHLCLAKIQTPFHISYDNRALLINGERKLIISGSIHYPRSMPAMWPELIEKAKMGGLNAIDTYVFWNAHEPLYRQYDFSVQLNLIRFMNIIHDHGMYAILRIGPYISAGWNYGGFPVWLHNIPGIELRTNNEIYKNEMKNFTTLIVEKLKGERQFASQGGPIILVQIENEYGNVESSYGQDGKKYIQWCVDLAISYRLGVPWIMSQESDDIRGMIPTCNGYYCDQYWPGHGLPKMWTETWTSSPRKWGTPSPYRPTEDLAFAVARFFQYGGSLQNYYMYHGGTNFGRTSGGPYLITSYSYDSLLDEDGGKGQPTWGHLKQLHEILVANEKILMYGGSKNVDYGNQTTATIYSYKGKQMCFFGNAHPRQDITIDYNEIKFTIPAWSVSILPDCHGEVYNTAKVNTPTTMVVMNVPNERSESWEFDFLEWKWTSEAFEPIKLDNHKDHKEGVEPEEEKEKDMAKTGYFSATYLLDQMTMNDTSDYLWYMTSVEIGHKDSAWMKEATLKVHTKGHILHVIINGRHVGSDFARDGKFEFDYVTKVKLNDGNNSISLLSATSGLPNYGAHFDKIKTGITSVKLTGGKNEMKDLQNNTWTYKVGIHGIDELKLYKREANQDKNWKSAPLPTGMFHWFKATFKTPTTTEPISVDLNPMGKGIAWVNGFNIGRYWAGFKVPREGCNSDCDYRGKYNAGKCSIGCGMSSQRWYHIPRSILNEDDNELVLFEEFGGNPKQVNVQTMSVKRVCAHAYEGNTIELACEGPRDISKVDFASFGNPTGSCPFEYKKGTCESPESVAAIEKACLRKDSCSINITESTFPNGCEIPNRRLAVQVVCSIVDPFN